MKPLQEITAPKKGESLFTTIKRGGYGAVYTIANIEGVYYIADGIKPCFISAIKSNRLVCSHFVTWQKVLDVIKYKGGANHVS